MYQPTNYTYYYSSTTENANYYQYLSCVGSVPCSATQLTTEQQGLLDNVQLVCRSRGGSSACIEAWQSQSGNTLGAAVHCNVALANLLAHLHDLWHLICVEVLRAWRWL